MFALIDSYTGKTIEVFTSENLACKAESSYHLGMVHIEEVEDINSFELTR